MTSQKATETLRSRKQSNTRAVPAGSKTRLGQFEKLETRELLSSFQPVGANFQWITRGKTPLHEIRFDAAGDCVAVINPLASSNTPNCALDQFGTPPNRIVVPFSGQINRATFKAFTDVTISGDLDPTNSLRVIRGTASKNTLTLYTAGGFASGAGNDITLAVHDIQGRSREWMSPWSATLAVSDGGGTVGCGAFCPETTAPTVIGITPSYNESATGPTNFVEALFSEDLQPASVTSPNNFQLIGSGGPITAASITYDPATDRARFTASGPLANGTYQVRLAGTLGGIRDLAGNLLDGNPAQTGPDDFVSTFQVNVAQPIDRPSISPGDITPPVVAAVQPQPRSSVPSSPGTVTVAFNESLNPASVTSSAVRLLASGRDGTFGNSSDREVPIQSVQYNDSIHQLVVGLGELLGEDLYRLVIGGNDSFRDLALNTLDGDRDGSAGGIFISDFRVDLTAPALIVALAPASDTGVVGDNKTNAPIGIVIGGTVSDGSIWAPDRYRVELDADLDGQFDDGQATTDHSGKFVVAATSDFRAAESQTVRVKVTDPAGRSAVSETTIAVDTAPLLAAFSQSVLELSSAPSSITFTLSETPNPMGLFDLNNYSLIASGRDGVFVDQTASDVSSFLTGVQYNESTKQVTVSLAPGLSNDAYRLIVHSEGSLQDLAGNPLPSDVVLEFRIGNLTPVNGSPPAGAPGPGLANQIPQYRVMEFSTVNPALGQLIVRPAGVRTIAPGELITYSEIENQFLVNGLTTYSPGLNPNSPTAPQTLNGSPSSTAACEPLHPDIVGISAFPSGLAGVSLPTPPRFGQDKNSTNSTDPLNEQSDIEIRGIDDNQRIQFLSPTGTVIATRDFSDTDFYCFEARAGEVVRFEVSDILGRRFTNVPWLAIWDLGADGVPGTSGGNPENADRRLITNSLSQRNSFPPQFFGAPQLPPADFVELMITGITGSSLDNPQDQLAHPLGTELRQPGDRIYALEVDTDRLATPAIPATFVEYLIRGSYSKPAPTATGNQQIIFVDFDGEQNVRGFTDSFGTDVLIDVPAFDIRDYGLDPVFTDEFMDMVLEEVRNDLARVGAQAINTGLNQGFTGPTSRIGSYSFDVLDSRHFLDPGNLPNVIHIHVGGIPGIAGFGSGIVGVAANVDTGNQNINPDFENALVFSTELARQALQGIEPATFGPSTIPELASQLGETISHEAGHLLGLWHTRFEGAEAANYGTVPPSCTPELDNIADPEPPALTFDANAPQGLVTNLTHRFDRFRDSNFNNNPLLPPFPPNSLCNRNIAGGVVPAPPGVNVRTEVTGLEFFEGVADSVGTLAWGMTGSATIASPPRVLGVDVLPGEIKIVFSENIDVSTLRTTTTGTPGSILKPTVGLVRAGGDNAFTTNTDPGQCGIFLPGSFANPYPGTDCFIPLREVKLAGPGVTGDSIFDPNTNTLTIRVDDRDPTIPTDPITGNKDLRPLVVADRYRLILRSNSDQTKDPLDPNNPSILDRNTRLESSGTLCVATPTRPCGFRLDGEIVADPQQRISSLGERFPTGDGVEGGDMLLDFVVSDRFTVDGDLPKPADPTVLPPTFSTRYAEIQAAISDTEFASLSSTVSGIVDVTVVPADTAYKVENSNNPFQPRHDIVVPDRTHLVFDGNQDIARVLFVATPRTDNPTTLVNESTQGRIYRVDANTGAVLSSFLAPLPLANNVGLAFDGGSLFVAEDALGSDTRLDSVFVLDPFTVDSVTGNARVVNTFNVPSSAAGGTNIDGLAVNGPLLFASDSESNKVLLLNKSNGTLVGNIPLSFDLVGGIDFDATTRTLWATGKTIGGEFELHQIDPVTGSDKTAPFPALLGASAFSGVGVIGGEVFVSDQTTDKIFRLDQQSRLLISAFDSPALNPTALAGVPLSQLVVKLFGARIDVAGNEAALIATGASLDNPVVFTSTRDTTFLGSGVSTALPADWMGIAFRQDSDDFASHLENVLIRFGGGPGVVIAPNPACENPRTTQDQEICQDPRQRLGITQTLSPVTLFDARPTLINVEISNNAEAAIAATPDSFQRSLGLSGPDLFWDVDPGVPIPGDWDPTHSGVEFGLYQSSTGKVFVDANSDRQLQRTEDRNCNGGLDAGEDANANFTLDRNDGGCPFAQVGQTPVVGNFSATAAGDEIATFDRRTGLWTIDRNHDFMVAAGVEDGILFGQHGDVPIVGDWDGDGVDQIGVFRPRPRPTDVDPNCQTAALKQAACFVLDLNNNGRVDASSDQNGNGLIDPNEQGEDFIFGLRDDVPIVGDFATDDINADGLLNDGNPALPGHAALLNEITAGVDYNGDGKLLNDLISEDLNADGFFNPFFEDLNGNGLFNNGIAAAFLDEVADNLDYNGDGLKVNVLINEDRNGNGKLDDGISDIGIYRPMTGEFAIDRNGNRMFDPGEQDANANGKEDPSEVKGRPNGRIDLNDGPVVFGVAGGQPVIGNWCIDNPLTPSLAECAGDEIGVVDSSLKWFVDSNGNLKQDNSELAVVFGQVGDVATPGDWATQAGAQGDEFGVFRPANGLWFTDNDSDNKLDPTEDLDFDGRLDVREDTNGNNQLDLGEDRDQDGRLDVNEDLDPDGGGPLLPNGLLDLNDGGFKFTAALRDDISAFVFRNSLNAVWVKPGLLTVPDAHWDDIQIVHVLTGTLNVQGKPDENSTLDLSPTLELEPGLVVKMGLANLNVGGFGATLLIDSDLEVGEPRVVFTSLLDDTRGPSGRKNDTNNDSGSLQPLPGDWGGIVVSRGAAAVINGAEILFGGNLRVPATTRDPQTLRITTNFISPSPITLNRGPVFATITNNIIANTNNLQNITSPRTLPSDIAAIAIVGAGALGEGPNTPRDPCFCNANPFIRGNNVSQNNGLKGLEIRMTNPFDVNVSTQDPPSNPLTFPDTLLETNSRWDDTDITHILLGTLQFASLTPLPPPQAGVNATPLTLTLASNPKGTFDEFDSKIETAAESLILKLGGRYSLPNSLSNAFAGAIVPPAPGNRFIGAGFNVGFDDANAATGQTAAGFDLGFGATMVVDGLLGDPARGIPSAPVILTSIRDDSAGPKGVLSEDTNNDSTQTLPAAGDWEGIEIGAWARNFGRISPINGTSLSSSFIRGADIRFANTAVLMQSQSVEVSSSLIRNSNLAINATQGPALPAAAGGGQRDPSQPLIVNNLLVSNGLAYRQVGGADNANDQLEVPPPRSIFINNTVDRNTAGINLAQRSGSLIMNNSFTNTTGTAVTIDASSISLNRTPPELGSPHQPVQVVRNLFFANGNNGTTGTIPAGIGGLEIINQDPQYVSAAAPDFNYRPTSGSPLVDSALSEFGSVNTEFGFVQAPDRDKTGVFRQDHFPTPNIGIGSRPWLDIGAVELVDLQSAFPRIVSMNPLPATNFQNGFGPALVELEFSEAVTNVGTTTFFVEASGGDQSFLEGNEVRLAGQVAPISGSAGTRWVFVPNSASNFNNFQNELFRVTAIGTGSTPIVSVATGDSLDGEFVVRLPSGDGVEGGDFRATFSIGDVIGRALYVDDSTTPCVGVPRNDPNLRLFTPTVVPLPLTPVAAGLQLQQALSVALPGDFILVCPGVYTAPLTVTVPVTLESIEGAMPRKNAQGQLIVGTGTFITVTGGQTAITINNVSNQAPLRIGSTRGGVNHGFVITSSPISGPITPLPTGIGIDVVGTAVEIEGNIIVLNSIGIRADSGSTARLPNILNNLIVGNTNPGFAAGGAGIDITSRNKDALASILNNTISYNQAGILLREDGLDPSGRVVATVQNNVITSNTLTGLSTVSAKASPNLFHNDAWGNGIPNQSSNFGGTLTNLPPSASDLAGNPIPDAVCTPALTKCGNISVNPLFINPVDPQNVSDRAEFFRIANFELQSTSKLIDRAKDKGSPSRDFKGRTRIVDIPGVGNETSPPPPGTPDSDPRSVDIGAFEFVPSALAGAFGVRESAGGARIRGAARADDLTETDDNGGSESGKLRLSEIRSELMSAANSTVRAEATDDLLNQLAFQLGGSELRKSQLRRIESLVDEYLGEQ